MQNSPVAVGQTIAQKYQVEKVIGEGGMGLVVAAWHIGLQQRVAIKFVLADLVLDHDSSAERFQREARAAARIRSEHVCRVLDVGTLDTGVPFMVMEYLEGCDLSAELARQGRLSVSDALEYILQACEALAEAHAAGIVHRDLKPANLFLARRADGTRAIKVLDFGVSKSLVDSGMSKLSLTKSATLIGSPIYMSPEQLESSKDVDARTDIWALGAILYELLSGRTPFDAHSMPQLVAAVLHTEPSKFSQLGVSLPGGLESAVMRALAKNRDNRYASIAEFTQGLAPFAPAHAEVSVNRVARVLGPGARERSGLPAPSTSESAAARGAPTPQPVERISTTTSQTSGRRWLWAVLAIAPLLIGLGILLSRGSNNDTNRAAAPGDSTLPAAHFTTGSDKPAQPTAPAAAAQAPHAVAAAAPDAGPETKEEEAPAAAAVAPTPTAPTTAPSTPSPHALPTGVDLPRSKPASAPAATKRPESTKTRRAPDEPSTNISDFGGRR